MAKRTDTGMPHLDDLAGLFHPTQKFVETIGRQGRTSRERIDRGIDEADGDEVLLRVERAIRIKRHASRQRVLMQQNGVAVWFGAGSPSGGDHAASAADIFYYDRLA